MPDIALNLQITMVSKAKFVEDLATRSPSNVSDWREAKFNLTNKCGQLVRGKKFYLH